MEEVWVALEDYPGYSVSSLGRVRNENRGRLVKPSHTKQGALKVGMVIGGRQHTRSVKTLVAEVFIPNTNEMFNTPIHLDGDQDNVTVENLAWRPRWFAWKYAKQMGSLGYYLDTNPIRDAKTSLVYSSIADAALANGLLFKELELSVNNQIPVYPIWRHFEWA